MAQVSPLRPGFLPATEPPPLCNSLQQQTLFFAGEKGVFSRQGLVSSSRSSLAEEPAYLRNRQCPFTPIPKGERVAQVSLLRPGFLPATEPPPLCIRCSNKPRSQNRDLGHPVLFAGEQGVFSCQGLVSSSRSSLAEEPAYLRNRQCPFTPIPKGERVAQVSPLRPGFLPATEPPLCIRCSDKPRSQNRDLGHPVLFAI